MIVYSQRAGVAGQRPDFGVCHDMGGSKDPSFSLAHTNLTKGETAVLQFLRIRRWTHSAKTTYLKLRFSDGEILPKDAEKWARSVALRQWGGGINSQTKVRVEGIPGHVWWFDTWGHGGYVMVAKKGSFPEVLEKYTRDGCIYWGAYPDWAAYVVLVFEEDCDWAVLEWVYPEVGQYMEKAKGNREVTERDIRSWAWPCIARWQEPLTVEQLKELAKGA